MSESGQVSPGSKTGLLAALSCVLDLVEGQSPGHAVRTCLIAHRIADQLDVPERSRASLTMAALLKDTGCSASSARIHKIFGGDDHLAKGGIKFIDWSNPGASLKFAVKFGEPAQGFGHWMRLLTGGLNWPQRVMEEIAEARRGRGGEVAEQLGVGQEAAQAIRCLDEHWDGRGLPCRLAGEDIPILSRILSAAQTMEVFACSFGASAAYRMLKEREGRWFDPKVVAAAEAFGFDAAFWNRYVQATRNSQATFELPGDDGSPASDLEIDLICEAFAPIIDAKSALTRGHSVRVAHLAAGIARQLGVPGHKVKAIRRAALLHDIGKLGVPNAILDKPGRLSEEEMAQIRVQVEDAQNRLIGVPGLEEVSAIAFAHGDSLDVQHGWRGTVSADLPLESRILAAADVYDALVSERPYKPALSCEKALGEMHKRSAGLDPDCLAALSELQMGGLSHAA